MARRDVAALLPQHVSQALCLHSLYVLKSSADSQASCASLFTVNSSRVLQVLEALQIIHRRARTQLTIHAILHVLSRKLCIVGARLQQILVAIPKGLLLQAVQECEEDLLRLAKMLRT